MSLTLSTLSSPSINTQWKNLLSLEEEIKHKDNVAFWTTAQSATIIALCVLGAAILISPYALPITYTTILTNTFAIVPLLFPIPGYFYNYFVQEAAKASNLVKKIIFFRNEHPQIENSPGSLDLIFKDTFGESISNEKRALLEKTKNIHPKVLSFICFLKSEIISLQEKKEELKLSITSFKEKDLQDLLTNPLFLNCKDIINKELHYYKNNKTHSLTSDFLRSLAKMLKKSQPNDSKALIKIKELIYQWNSKDALPLSKKWEPFFELENKIIDAEINQLFLWTFLFRPEEDFKAALKRYNLEIENSLSEYPIKKNNLSFTDTAVGALYNESSINKILTLSNGETITKNELMTSAKRMIALEKILKEAENQIINKTNSFSLISK